jgi:Flp pilus assembly protein TadB
VNERLRIGDAEREAAAHELGEHFAMGRITADEHGERLEQIWAARTSADLAPAFADLPRPRPAQPAAPAPRRGWTGRPGPLPRVPFPVKLLIALVVVVLVFTHLPWVLVALLVYLFVIRRFSHRHPRSARWR